MVCVCCVIDCVVDCCDVLCVGFDCECDGVCVLLLLTPLPVHILLVVVCAFVSDVMCVCCW